MTNEIPIDTETAQIAQIAQLLAQIIAQLRMLNLKMDAIVARLNAYKP